MILLDFLVIGSLAWPSATDLLPSPFAPDRTEEITLSLIEGHLIASIAPSRTIYLSNPEPCVLSCINILDRRRLLRHPGRIPPVRWMLPVHQRRIQGQILEGWEPKAGRTRPSGRRKLLRLRKKLWPN